MPKNLNDPSTHVSRAEGMALMAARRREKVAGDMEPDDYKELVGTPAAVDPAADPPEEPASGITEHAADARPRERGVYEIAAALEAAQPDTPAAAPPAAQPAAPVTAPSAELDLTRKVKLKVNGVEVERTLEEVIAAAQKADAVDDYLQRSRDQLHSINQLADEVRAKLKSDPTPAPAAPADTTQEDPAEAGVAALFRGDEDKAKEAFRKLAQGANVDVAKVVALVRQEIRQEMTLDEARAVFLQAHPDADTNPIAVAAANSALRLELAKVGADRLEALTPQQIKPVFEAAARAMTAWRGGQTSPPPTPSVAPDPTRASKKTAIDELPAASARAVTEEAPPQTNSSVIAKMRSARPGSMPSVH